MKRKQFLFGLGYIDTYLGNWFSSFLYRIPFDVQCLIQGDCLDHKIVSQDTKYKVKFKQLDKNGDVVAIASSHIVEEADGTFRHKRLRVQVNEIYDKSELKEETKLDIVLPGRYDIITLCAWTLFFNLFLV